MKRYVMLALCANAFTGLLAAAEPALMMPQLERPAKRAEEGDPLHEKYETAWTRYEKAIGEVRDSVNAALDAEFDKAADAGNLELADLWDKKKKFLLDTKTLEWASDGAAKVDWRKKYPSSAFPESFNETVKTAAQACDAAFEELKQGYEGIIRDYTKARNLERAKQLREEVASLERSSAAPQPESLSAVDPKTAAGKKSRGLAAPVCRIGFAVAADGTSSGFIEEVAGGVEEAGEACVRTQGDGGLWTITHTFPDVQSCDPYRSSLLGKPAVAEYSPKAKAIELKPTQEVNGGWANLSSPLRIRLPAKVVVDIEATGQQAYVTLPLKTWPTNAEINVLTDDGFRTCRVSHLFVTFSRTPGSRPEIKQAWLKEGVPLSDGCRYEVRADPSMSLQEVWFTGVSAFMGPAKTCDGIKVKRITVTGRIAPVLGVGLKQDGDNVIVAQVVPSSLAESAGIKVGDRVRAVGGKSVMQLQRALQLLAVTELGEEWELAIDRDGKEMTFRVKADVR